MAWSAGPSRWSRTGVVDLTKFDFSTLTFTEKPNIPDFHCDVCGDLNFRPLPTDEEYKSRPFEHDINPEDLCQSAKAGCESCQLVLDGVHQWLEVEIDSEKYTLRDVEKLTLLSESLGSTLVAWIKFRTKGKTEYIEFFAPEGKASGWPLIGNARSVTADSSTPSCLGLAKKWLDNCLNNHAGCRRLSDTVLPTRVLDVGTERIVLVETKGQTGRYATLSHCWGNMTTSPHFRTTTKATLDEKKVGIPIQELPKTYQDAITVCRALSIPYLWIDSLCIMQDSADDWAIQAACMADYYQNSVVTIAADGADDGHGGCFVNGPDRSTRELSFTASHAESDLDGQSVEAVVRVRHHRIRSNWHEVAHYKRHHQRSRLSTRAWVLQERLMPVSILHFTSAELAWECTTEINCECTLASEPISDDTFIGNLLSSQIPLPVLGDDDFLYKWYRVVEEFTARRLTYESDRLPALSGLVSMVAKQTRRSYVAGLWESELAEGLLWRAEDTNSRGELFPCLKQQQYHAPSWSWASLTGLIKYDSHITNPRPKIDAKYVFGKDAKFSFTLSSQNPYGSVSAAHIDAEAFVVPVRLTKVGDKKYLVVSERACEPMPLREYRLVQLQPLLKHPDTTLKFVPLSQENTDKRYQTDTRFDQPKQFFVTDEARYQSFLLDIVQRRPRRVGPGERPYCMLDVDIKEGEGSVLDLEQQYLFVLVGFTREEIDEEVGTRVRVQAILVARDGDSLSTWKRIGRLDCIHYRWDDWSNIASPFRFRWV